MKFSVVRLVCGHDMERVKGMRLGQDVICPKDGLRTQVFGFAKPDQLTWYERAFYARTR